MGYLLIILFAVWNGLVIKWKHSNSGEVSKKWHSVGWWARVMVLVMMYQGLMPNWYNNIMNPATLLEGPIHAGVLTFLLVFGVSYWGYNYIINEINAWDWDYLEDNKNRTTYKILLGAWASVTISWGVWGDNIINYFTNLCN